MLSLECSSDTIEIQRECEILTLETTTFRQYKPWLGLTIKDPIKHPPYLLLEGAERAELFQFKDPATLQIWWIYSTGWNSDKNCHQSEMYRTAGTMCLIAQDQRYDIIVNAVNFTVAELEYYLRDFKNELWTLILNDQSAVKGNVEKEAPAIYSDELIDCLKNFIEAVENIARNPGVELKEVQARVPIKSVRPVNRTFMELSTKGHSRFLTGRSFQESLNTPNNQYVHYCLSRVLYLVTKLSDIGAARASAFEHAIFTSFRQLEKLDETKIKMVDQVVFDHEIEDIQNELQEQKLLLKKAVAGQEKTVELQGLVSGTYDLLLGKNFGNAESEFFCNRINGEDYKEIYGGKERKYLTVKLPKSFSEFGHQFILSRYEFSINGFHRWRSTVDSRKEMLEFIFIDEIKVIRSPLQIEQARLVSKRDNLVAVDWKVGLSETDHTELKNERKTITARNDLYKGQATNLYNFIDKINAHSKRLVALRNFFQKKSIGLRQTFPNSMAFVQNPDYSMSRASFRQIIAIPGVDSRLLDSMMVIEKIGLVNVANLYEKWCLLKILKVLTDIYGFAISDDWKARLIEGIEFKKYDLEFDLYCSHRKMKVKFTYEKWLKSGKRPDFVLDFTAYDFSTNKYREPTRLVLDAKFRDRLDDKSLSELIKDMYAEKNYSEDGKNQVFILHPSPKSIRERTSPLEWGSGSDYGQTSEHKFGGIYLAPSLDGRSSQDNLQRLIGMVLQGHTSYSVDENQQNHIEHNFTCIGCGNNDSESLKVRISTTEGGNGRRVLECAACKLRTVETVCAGCKLPLYKNGYYWTYHRTRAEQLSNIVCPSCSNFL